MRSQWQWRYSIINERNDEKGSIEDNVLNERRPEENMLRYDEGNDNENDSMKGEMMTWPNNDVNAMRRI